MKTPLGTDIVVTHTPPVSGFFGFTLAAPQSDKLNLSTSPVGSPSRR